MRIEGPRGEPLDLAVPTIHLNGTSKQSLLDALSTAEHALGVALETLHDASANGRDYYPQGIAAWERARAEGESRIARVRSVRLEIEALIIAIDNGGNQ